MTHATILFCAISAFMSAGISEAQMHTQIAPPPPQTPRQALIETFFGDKPDHLERHLTEAATKAFKKLDGGGSKSFLMEIAGLGMQMKAGAGQGFQIMETGPILLSAEEPGGRQKFEILVEHDELVGDEDQIELSLRMYEFGQQQSMPVLPRLTFAMKSEADIWRVNEINLSARMPLGDEDFLKDLVKNLQDKQQHQNETMTQFALQSIVRAENSYHASHADGAYLCSLSELAKVEVGDEAGGEQRKYRVINDELGAGNQNGYVFALSGCDAGHFKAVAQPSTSAAGKRAFCVDENGRAKYSKDGKATTCLMRGEEGDPNLPRVYTSRPE